MKTLLAVLWGVIILGTIGVIADLYLTSEAKKKAFKRATEFIAALRHTPLEDREPAVERFKMADPEAAIYLVVNSEVGVRFTI